MQNHILFLISDQPPINMASLLALFKTSTPLVVKRRAKELLSVITEAVKNSSSEPTELRAEDQVIDNSIEVQKNKVENQKAKVVMLDDERKNLQKESETQAMDIWGGLLSSSTQRIGVERHPFVVKESKSMASASTSCSMLFRSSVPSTLMPAAIHHHSLSTAVSSLFGTKGDNVVTVKSSTLLHTSRC